MKKFFAALCACLALAALASCGADDSIVLPFSDGDFAVTAEVVRGDLTYTAAFSRRGGARTLTFLSPETLSTLSVTEESGVCTLAIGDLSFASPEAEALFAPFALFDVPRGCLTDSREENGLTVYEGVCGDDRYKIALDAAGVPVRLEGVVGGESFALAVTKFEFDTPSDGTAQKGRLHE